MVNLFERDHKVGEVVGLESRFFEEFDRVSKGDKLVLVIVYDKDVYVDISRQGYLSLKCRDRNNGDIICINGDVDETVEKGKLKVSVSLYGRYSHNHALYEKLNEKFKEVSQ